MRHRTLLLLALCGCMAPPVDDAVPTAPSWDEFRAATTRVYDGRAVDVVEGDLALSAD